MADSKLGTVGVDSGYLLIIDPCYIGDTIPVETIKQALRNLAKINGESCAVSEPGGYVDLGLLFRVHMDGGYGVTVTREDGQITEVKINLGLLDSLDEED